MEHFYIIANSEKPESVTLRDKIVGYLNRRGKTCSYQENAQPSENHAYSFTDPARVPEDIDAVLVLGGDGTVIQAARDLARRDVAGRGMNVGPLGYRTEVEASGDGLRGFHRGRENLRRKGAERHCHQQTGRSACGEFSDFCQWAVLEFLQCRWYDYFNTDGIDRV